MREGKTEEEKERKRETESKRGVRTNRNVLLAGSRLPCEVAGYIALSCKHALTASSRRRWPSSPSRPPPSRVPSSYLSRDHRGRRRLHRHRYHRRRRSRSCRRRCTSITTGRPSRRTRKRLTLAIWTPDEDRAGLSVTGRSSDDYTRRQPTPEAFPRFVIRLSYLPSLSFAMQRLVALSANIPRASLCDRYRRLALIAYSNERGTLLFLYLKHIYQSTLAPSKYLLMLIIHVLDLITFQSSLQSAETFHLSDSKVIT